MACYDVMVGPAVGRDGGACIDDVQAVLSRSARRVGVVVSLVGQDLRGARAMPAPVVLAAIA